MVDIEKQMQFYIDLGIYTENELELIRKKLTNENKNITSSSVPGIEPASGPKTQTDIDIANVRENIIAGGGVLNPETDVDVSSMEYPDDNLEGLVLAPEIKTTKVESVTIPISDGQFEDGTDYILRNGEKVAKDTFLKQFNINDPSTYGDNSIANHENLPNAFSFNTEEKRLEFLNKSKEQLEQTRTGTFIKITDEEQDPKAIENESNYIMNIPSLVKSDGYHFNQNSDNTIKFLNRDLGYGSTYHKKTGNYFQFETADGMTTEYILAIDPNGNQEKFETDFTLDGSGQYTTNQTGRNALDEFMDWASAWKTRNDDILGRNGAEIYFNLDDGGNPTFYQEYQEDIDIVDPKIGGPRYDAKTDSYVIMPPVAVQDNTNIVINNNSVSTVVDPVTGDLIIPGDQKQTYQDRLLSYYGAEKYQQYLEYKKTGKFDFMLLSAEEQQQAIYNANMESDDKSFHEDLYTSLNNGKYTGQSVDDAFEIFNQGKDISEEDLQKSVEALVLVKNLPQTRADYEWQKTLKQEGYGVWGTMAAYIKNPDAGATHLLRSLSTAGYSLIYSDEVQKSVLAGGGAGLATSWWSGYGAFARTATGAYMGLTGSMETALTMSDLLEKELITKAREEGVQYTVEYFNAENVRDILNDVDAVERIYSQGLARGLTIAAMQGLGVGISRGVAKNIQKKGIESGTSTLKTVSKQAGAVTLIEGGTDFSGELLGQIAADQDVDLVAATQEGLLGVTGNIAVVDIVANTVKNKQYKVNGGNLNKETIRNMLNSKNVTNADILGMNIEIKNDPVFEAFVNNKIETAKLEIKVDPKVENQADRNTLVNLEKQRQQAEKDVKKTGLASVPGAKKKLEDIQAQIDGIINKYSSVDGRTSSVRARKKLANILEQAEADAKLENNIEFAKKHSALYNLEVNDKLTVDEIRTQYGDEAAVSDGFIVNDEIIINKEVARQTKAVNVGSHELLHGILRKAVQEGKIFEGDIKTELKNRFGDQWSVVEQRAKENYSTEYMDKYKDEWITLTSDAIANGDITFDQGIFSNIGEFFTPILRAFGFKQINFDDANGVYEFLKDYNNSIHKGALSTNVIRKTGGTVTDADRTIRYSKADSDAVQQIYEEQGQRGAYQIIDKFKPITNRIVNRRSQAPGFDRELLTSEIEIGKGGILDLIRTYNPDAGVPLAAYINQNLPLRAIEASKRILGEEFVQEITAAENIVIEQETPSVAAKPKRKKIVLSERLGVKNEVDQAIEDQLSGLDFSKLTFKNLKNLVPDIVGEMFGIAPKKLITNANITKSELQSSQMFISKNADILIAMLPEGNTASGTSTGVPNSILKAFYTKTDRAKMTETGSKAGLAVQVKNKINRKEFLEVFGIIDGVPVRTDRNTSARVLSLANLTGKMMSNQAVRQQIKGLNNYDVAVQNIKDGTPDVMYSKTKETADEAGEKKLKSFAEKYKLKYEPIEGDITSFENNHLQPASTIATYDLGVLRATDLISWYNKGKNKAFQELIREIPKLYTDVFVVRGRGKEKAGIEKHPRMDQDFRKLLVKLNKGEITEKTFKNEVEELNRIGRYNFIKFWNLLNDAITDNPKDKVLPVAAYRLTLSSTLDSSHPAKTGAPIKYIDVTVKGKPEVIKFEHAVPNIYVIETLMNSIMDGNFKEVFGQILRDDVYIQAAVRKTDADVIDKLSTKIGPGENFDLNKSTFVNRFFNKNTANSKEFNLDPENLQSIDDNQSVADKYNINKAGNIRNSKSNIENINKLNNAIIASRSTNRKPRGITILDFDDTLATTESLVKYTAPDGTTGTLNAEQYASGYESLQDQGYTFDFSDFNKVVKGKLAPLFEKAMKLQGKFGPENMFVLTARPPAAQKPIFDFLKGNGLNIPLKNITGLGNSTADAKALWVADKVAEGYNDFYFADDALQNVQAVKNMLDQFDVKSKVQQARVKFSKSAGKEFNTILEEVTGIQAEKRFSDVKARKRGADKGKFRFFIPPSHEDFVGLIYNFLGKGEAGNRHRDFFERVLIRPLNRAYRELDTAKQSIANDYKNLNKQMPDVKKKLKKKTPDGDFTFEDAIRVYIWNKNGYKIPGLSKTDQANLVKLVMDDTNLMSYAENINTISKQKEYVDPTESWESGDIRTDLDDATGRVGRQQFFTEFNENAQIVFSPENLNKIEAAYGRGFRSALEDILYRTETGRNRPAGQNQLVNRFMNYINGSVGSVMFFNMRSALLQQMSMVNFINFADNNIFKAAARFADQKQYWADWAFIFNSDMLKQRRGGIKTDVNGAELAASLRKAKNKPRALIAKLLQIGFLPTQIGDNIAIATGGATFYRNRINTYLKQGLSEVEAKNRAFDDFQAIAEATQQSARPDMVSQQQASPLGKIILAFQNVTSQFNRLGKKAFLDIKNRRITPGNTTQLQSDISNVSRILYYFAMQNLIFYTLQTALFALMFDDEKEDEDLLKKKEYIINGSLDSVLRGSGLMGATVATLKNMYIKFNEQREKEYNPDESAVLMEFLNLSPPLGIKARKIVNAEKTLNYNEDVIKEMETFDIDNPVWSAVTNVIEGVTNIPVNRLYRKTQNIQQALNSQNSAFQRALLFLGWSQYNLGIEDTTVQEVKEDIKEKKKTDREEKRLQEKYPGKTKEEIKLLEIEKDVFDLNKREQVKIIEGLDLNPSDYPKEQNRVDIIMEYYNKDPQKMDSTLNAIENYVPDKQEQREIDLFKMNKKDQVNMLIDLGLSPKQIKALKYEEDRVKKIIQLENKKKVKN